MGKRKDVSTCSGTGKEEVLIWNHAMDSFLIDALVHQTEIGNRVGGTFTTKAYDNIVKKLSERIPEKNFDKERIKNRIKYIKRGWQACYDIFKNGLSGFSWDPIKNMWGAEPEVWDKLIEAHPDAASWRNKPIYNYDKLIRLYGVDRATGEEAETASEMRERERNLRQTNQNYSTIEEIDRMVSNDEVILEGYNEPTNENSPPINKQSAGTSNKKAKTKELKDDDIVVLKESFHAVAEAILKSTTEFVKSQPVPATMPMGELWNVLVELGFEGTQRNTAYIFLINNPAMLDGFLGCPPSERKNLLLQMIAPK